MEPFLGQIYIVGFTFAPRGFATCDGQLLSIAQNTALFSLLGTMYGGNGQTTFALPDLRGRVPIHMGQGSGIPARSQGETGGSASVTLTTQNMPTHTHSLNAFSESGNVASPQNAFLASTGALDPEYRTSGTSVQMAAQAISTVGGNQPFNTMPPYLVLNFVIALEGIYPSRN